jgi:hypothetical protein
MSTRQLESLLDQTMLQNLVYQTSQHDVPSEQTYMITPTIEYHESDRLTTIDGFAARNGDRAKITIRVNLTPQEKQDGVKALLSQILANSGPGVYLWNTTDSPPEQTL